MSNQDFEAGTSTIEKFFWWINERHRIYLKKQAGDAKPWTMDPHLQHFKFTNVFRELDRGTVALKQMLLKGMTMEPTSMFVVGAKANLLVFNICWYRLYNWHEHAINPGFSESVEDVVETMRAKWDAEPRRQVFTSAHMTTGCAGEDKVDTYARAVQSAWDNAPAVVEACHTDSMESTFRVVEKNYLCGNFVSYEIVCDLRFTPLLDNAQDRLTWANVGPGAHRGLRRLGMMGDKNDQEEGLAAMVKLYRTAPKYLSKDIKPLYKNGHYPPFELREIEHSLCEFDKYERTASGLGRPRQRYNGNGV